MNLNIKPKTLKIPEESKKIALWLHLNQRLICYNIKTITHENINNWTSWKLNNRTFQSIHPSIKNIVKRMKRCASDWEKYICKCCMIKDLSPFWMMRGDISKDLSRHIIKKYIWFKRCPTLLASRSMKI